MKIKILSNDESVERNLRTVESLLKQPMCLADLACYSWGIEGDCVRPDSKIIFTKEDTP